jgi:hypothetical protein
MAAGTGGNLWEKSCFGMSRQFRIAGLVDRHGRYLSIRFHRRRGGGLSFRAAAYSRRDRLFGRSASAIVLYCMIVSIG